MSYHVYIFRVETRDRCEQSGDADFLEDRQNLGIFTAAQRQSLQDKIEMVGFEVTGSSDIRFENAMCGATALLTRSGLYLSANSEEGIFEISMWASEWAAEPAFAKFDPQQGEWE